MSYFIKWNKKRFLKHYFKHAMIWNKIPTFSCSYSRGVIVSKTVVMNTEKVKNKREQDNDNKGNIKCYDIEKMEIINSQQI